MHLMNRSTKNIPMHSKSAMTVQVMSNIAMLLHYCTLCCSSILLMLAIILCVDDIFLCYPFSDGMSRTGVFITCMSEIERVKVEGGVDIFQTVKAAREQRPHMVYTSVSYCQNFEST